MLPKVNALLGCFVPIVKCPVYWQSYPHRKQLKDRDTLIEQSPYMLWITVMLAQKLEIHQKKMINNWKIARLWEKYWEKLVRKKRIAGKKKK